MFNIGDKVVIDQQGMIDNDHMYVTLEGSPMRYRPHPAYNDKVGTIGQHITKPFVGVFVDWEDFGMLPMHEWEIKLAKESKENDGQSF